VCLWKNQLSQKAGGGGEVSTKYCETCVHASKKGGGEPQKKKKNGGQKMIEGSRLFPKRKGCRGGKGKYKLTEKRLVDS